jgi:hypothetical protein
MRKARSLQDRSHGFRHRRHRAPTYQCRRSDARRGAIG